MANVLLRWSVGLLGAAAILIGLSNFLFGGQNTATFFIGVLNQVTGRTGSPAELASPDADNELRFYAVFWIAYGAVLIREVTEKTDRMARLPLLLALFFAGGIGRVLSLLTLGPANSLFSLLMWIELALPIVLYGLWVMAQRSGVR